MIGRWSRRTAARRHRSVKSGPLDIIFLMGPLTGLRVLEFEAIGPGPFAGMMLADMGARITEVLFEVGGQYRHDM